MIKTGGRSTLSLTNTTPSSYGQDNIGCSTEEIFQNGILMVEHSVDCWPCSTWLRGRGCRGPPGSSPRPPAGARPLHSELLYHIDSTKLSN
jgi:hypothetical protein